MFHKLKLEPLFFRLSLTTAMMKQKDLFVEKGCNHIPQIETRNHILS